MGNLGVKQIYSDERNLRIIAEKFKQNPQLTYDQTRFLIACWSRDPEQKKRAQNYFEFVKRWRRLGILDRAIEHLYGKENLEKLDKAIKESKKNS